MRISIFGLGYVGCVSAACLADLGHDVIGVDVNPQKLDMIRNGHSPIIEPGLDELLAKVVHSGKLTVTDEVKAAIRGSDVSLICVGTPSRANGSLDTHYLDRVIEQIGGVLADLETYHVVAVRSTLLPGVLTNRIVPLLETASRKIAGKDFGVCVNPEFLRESSAIKDFQNPPFTIIGEINERSGKVLAAVYFGIDAPLYHVEPDAAAMVKYASNTYHALKVAFANEVGAVCKELGIESQKVMNIFCQDNSLNISAAYLKPGFAFGGSCLPKDVRALLYAAKHRDVQAPLLSAILPSNDVHIQRAVEQVAAINKRNVALLGLSFKPGTDDLRESPLVRLAETLIGKGYRLSIYDEEVSLSHLFGRNREYIEQVLPHINDLLRTDLPAVIKDAEVLIIGKRFAHLENIRSSLRKDHVVIDLVRTGDWQPAERRSVV